MTLGQKLVSLLGGKADGPKGPTPARLTYAVGDIHGHLTLLEQMIERIEADRAGAPADIVFLGDYIDRGPESAGVLRRLRALSLPEAEVTCLMGNHERMMLDFLSDPESDGDRWLGNGGRDTVTSFTGPDWCPPVLTPFADSVRAALHDSFEAELRVWLEGRPLQWRSGDLGCVHATTDPLVGWDEQDEQVLLWARARAQTPARKDGVWVAHGHTPVKAAHVHKGRIALDTGAYFSGTLSAARFEDGQVQLLTVTDPAFAGQE